MNKHIYIMRNTIKHIICILSLFLSFSYAQAQTEAEIRNDEAFKEVLEKQITFTVTDSRENFRTIYDFQKLVPEDFDAFTFGRYNPDFKEWISERIDDSGFESVEDAMARYKTFTDAMSRNLTQQTELNKEINKVREKFKDKELFETVFTEE